VINDRPFQWLLNIAGGGLEAMHEERRICWKGDRTASRECVSMWNWNDRHGHDRKS